MTAAQRYRSVFAPGLYAGRRIVVTGGGSGIGRCTAHELASLGAEVLLCGRKADKLERVRDEIVEDGGQASIAAFDIRDEAAVRDTVASLLAGGPIYGLVNNAGGQFPSPAQAIGKKGFEAVVATNLTGGFLVARELYTQHFARHGGAIVNMLADMWGGMPAMAHSGAARAGMLNLTQTLAVEWASRGVRVNAVAPGFVASSGMDSYDPSFTREVIPQMAAEIPLGRLADESEVSAAIVFLLSDAASFITGAVLCIDGGGSLNTKLFPLSGVPADSATSRPYDGFHRAQPPAALDALKPKLPT
ncbi:SDR family oxidoreductase [Solimonas marina]|uniref:Peroxisomal trans-2-enoyl-CoA reductase n=1 Tax=Solimonas marina TaxID=2714601 RepID=A0A969WDU0_9GAMM|nr:SDR family oxidoreductase [Solimonas marina]NKF23551.1 SDR family oxidoreductase [Solimonas marina]